MSAVKTLIGVPQDGKYLNMGFKTQDEQVSIHFLSCKLIICVVLERLR
jgi:hypothetical protein|tara:strand:+ start:81 stop:224 length:144 start_codon:yes stop_codon:yes gene_type:complete